MAETPLSKKLGIKPDHKLLVLGAPDGYLAALGVSPAVVDDKPSPGRAYDAVQVFVRSRADVDALAPTALQVVKPGGLLWFTYPKKSSSVKTDINRDAGWDALSHAGWRPVTQIAVDDTWSALRFRPEADVTPRRAR